MAGLEGDHRNTLREYLLGRLGEPVEGEVEERLFRDEDYFEQLEVAEDQLILDYLRSDLPAADHRAFERFYLISDERKEKVAERRLLSEAIDRLPRKAAPRLSAREFLGSLGLAPRLGFAMAGLALLGSGMGILIQNRDLARRIEQARRDTDAAERMARDERSAREQVETRLGRITAARFALMPILRAGADSQQITVGTGAGQVVLQLYTEPSGRHPVGLVKVFRGRDQLTSSFATGPIDTSSPKGVEVAVPVEGLPDGEVRVELLAGATPQTLQSIGAYSVQVTRR